MPGVGSNTIYECAECQAKFDFEDIRGANEPCPFCGHHQYKQVRVVSVCDFCSDTRSESELWTYYCEDFQYPVHIVGIPDGGSKGAWAACDTCHELIESNDRRALALRSTDRDIKRHPSAAPHKNTIFAIAKAIHDGFFEHRIDRPPVKGAGP
jgi:DNA-directed RNA polymerase subunit RPC12/RpoP